MENDLERKFRYGIWKMPEWNGRFQEWNGRQYSILPFQFHTRFRALHLQKKIYLQMSGSDKYCCHRSIPLKYLPLLFVNKSRYFGCVYCVDCVCIASYSKNIAICSIDVTVDDFDRFALQFFLFPDWPFAKSYFFFHTHECLYLLFHLRFSLILFIRLVFKLIVIVFGVKVAWYLHCGKCFSAVWLCQIS